MMDVYWGGRGTAGPSGRKDRDGGGGGGVFSGLAPTTERKRSEERSCPRQLELEKMLSQPPAVQAAGKRWK